jgi:hypothetical protein
MNCSIRVAAVTAALALGLLVGEASQAAGLPNKPKPIALTNDEIPAALLAVGDFPTGWSTATPPEGASTASATDGICNGPNALSRALDAGLVGHGEIRFTSNPSQGPFVDEFAYSFPSDRRAKAYVKATGDQASACTAPWQSTPPGLPTGATERFTIAALAFPKVAGDQVLAARETGTEQLNGQDLQTASSDQVLVRKGNHVFAVAYTASSPDPNQLQTYVRKAYSKLATELRNAQRHAK